jgi:excisionase family DNA binding protein
MARLFLLFRQPVVPDRSQIINSPSLTSGHFRTAVVIRVSTRGTSDARIDLARCTINLCTVEFLCGERPVRYSQREKNGSGQPPASSPKPEEPTIPFSQRLSCTIDEACEATSLGRTKLYELIAAGQLATTTVGRRRLVIVRGLLSLLEANKSTCLAVVGALLSAVFGQQV